MNNLDSAQDWRFICNLQCMWFILVKNALRGLNRIIPKLALSCLLYSEKPQIQRVQCLAGKKYEGSKSLKQQDLKALNFTRYKLWLGWDFQAHHFHYIVMVESLVFTATSTPESVISILNEDSVILDFDFSDFRNFCQS